MLTAFSLAAPSPTTAAPSPTTVTWGKEPMRLSSTGPESTLPTFMFMSGAEEGGDIFAGFNFSGGTGTPNPYMPGTTCPERVWENTMDDLRVPQLPWAVQEDWGCERTPTEVDEAAAEAEVGDEDAEAAKEKQCNAGAAGASRLAALAETIRAQRHELRELGVRVAALEKGAR